MSGPKRTRAATAHEILSELVWDLRARSVALANRADALGAEHATYLLESLEREGLVVRGDDGAPRVAIIGALNRAIEGATAAAMHTSVTTKASPQYVAAELGSPLSGAIQVSR